jgi:Na+/phosphate symporter
MEKPHTVHKAINLIWVLIALSVLVALINQWTGQIYSGEFIFALIVNALFCIIPFKLSSRSNAARYVFAALVIISALMLIGGAVENLTKLDLIFGVITMPLYVFCVYLLFTKEATAWFSGTSPIDVKERKEPTL